MSLNLPEQSVFTLDELCERWGKTRTHICELVFDHGLLRPFTTGENLATRGYPSCAVYFLVNEEAVDQHGEPFFIDWGRVTSSHSPTFLLGGEPIKNTTQLYMRISGKKSFKAIENDKTITVGLIFPESSGLTYQVEWQDELGNVLAVTADLKIPYRETYSTQGQDHFSVDCFLARKAYQLKFSIDEIKRLEKNNLVELRANPHSNSLGSLKHWLLCEKYTVAEAAYLILEIDPNTDKDALLDVIYEKELKALQKALDQAGMSDAIKAEKESDMNGYQWVVGLYKDSLIQWLEKNKVKAPLFLPDSPQAGDSQTPPYLNKDHPCYSPKLALAVRAWEAVALGDEYQNSSRTVKQNIEAVAQSMAVEVGLVSDGEKAAAATIDQVAKVANWNTVGGAPKTPTKS